MIYWQNNLLKFFKVIKLLHWHRSQKQTDFTNKWLFDFNRTSNWKPNEPKTVRYFRQNSNRIQSVRFSRNINTVAPGRKGRPTTSGRGLESSRPDTGWGGGTGDDVAKKPTTAAVWSLTIARSTCFPAVRTSSNGRNAVVNHRRVVVMMSNSESASKPLKYQKKNCSRLTPTDGNKTVSVANESTEFKRWN